MEFLEVITTTDEEETAEKIAKVLLEKRLAGCVQIIGPIMSWYWWKGKIEKAGEYLCLIKTREEIYEEVERAIREVHPYEVPEIVAFPLVRGNHTYLQWLSEETKGK